MLFYLILSYLIWQMQNTGSNMLIQRIHLRHCRSFSGFHLLRLLSKSCWAVLWICGERRVRDGDGCADSPPLHTFYCYCNRDPDGLLQGIVGNNHVALRNRFVRLMAFRRISCSLEAYDSNCTSHILLSESSAAQSCRFSALLDFQWTGLWVE